MAVTHNEFYDLDDLGSPMEPPPGWAATGAGARNGVILNSAAGPRYYTRSDLDIANGQGWQIEAVFNGPALGGAGELGARMWARFTDPLVQALPPPVPKVRHIEVRLEETAGNVRRIALVDGLNGVEMASLNLDWSDTAPRFRVRLKRQQTAGGDYIVLQAEASRTGPLVTDPFNWDDPGNRNPDPDTANSQKVLLSAFTYVPGTGTEFGFGNIGPGAYNSFWENIHVTRSDDLATEIPYWPPVPPAPTLSHDDMGVDTLQGVDLDVDLGPPGAYLANDIARLTLNTLSGPDTRNVPDPSSASGGLQHEDFDNLIDSQTVSGDVLVEDASGRPSQGPSANLDIPDRTSPTGELRVEQANNPGVFDPPLGAYNNTTQPIRFVVDVVDATIDVAASTFTLNGGAPQSIGPSIGAGALPGSTRHELTGFALVQGANTIVADLVDTEGQTNATLINAAFDLDTVAPTGAEIVVSDVLVSPPAGTFNPPAAGAFNSQLIVGVRIPAAHMGDLHYGDGSPPPNPPFQSTFTLNGSTTPIDTLSGYGWAPGGPNDVLYLTAPVAAEMLHTASAYLEDLAGNSFNVTADTFTLDLSAPTGDLAINDGGGWAPPGATYPTGPLDFGVEITSGMGDLDSAASYLQVQQGAGAPVQQFLNAATLNGNRFEWTPSPAINADDTYNVCAELFDNLGNTSGKITAVIAVGGNPSFFIAGSQGNNANAVTVSHTNDDNTGIDPTGLLILGPGNDNFIGVRISNDAAADIGDCKFRHFSIPACLFTGTSEWRLIHDTGAAPVVPNIAPGTDAASVGNVNFNHAHLEFPQTTDTVWINHASGDMLHTCTAVVLHSPQDPLLLPDGLGGFIPINDADFDDPAQFRAVIMAAIDSYNGSTGGYWQAVYDNPKIANRNINIQNVGT